MSSRRYTAAELAALRLPGLPTTARGVRYVAERDGWRAEPSGAAFTYAVTDLPAASQRALSSEQAAEVPERYLGVVERRIRAIDAVRALVDQGARIGDAITKVAASSEDVTARALRDWLGATRELARAQWPAALTPKWCNPRAATQTAECHADAWEAFKADYLRGARPALTASYRRTQELAAKHGWSPVPSIDAMRTRLEREVSRAAIELAREGRDAVARLYPSQRRTRDHFGALEAVTADGHRFDVQVRWPDGVVERPMMVAVQDLRSSAIIGWRIDRTENASLVRLVFGDVVRDHGIPDHIYFDNGRAFAAKGITGGAPERHRFKVKAEEEIGVLVALGVGIHWTTPYHGQAKPIERAFLDLAAENIAKHPLCEGAYTGRSPLHKPHNYGTRTVELAAFIGLVRHEVESHNRRRNREAHADGRSFQEVFDASYRESPIRKVTSAQQRLFLLASEAVTVQSGTGFVRLLGTDYWSEKTADIRGQRVVLRYDPDDLSQVHVYTRDGEFVCTAQPRSTVRFNDVSQARAHTRARAAYVKAARTQLEAARTMTAGELAELHFKTAAPAAELKPASKVVRPVFGKPAKGPGPAKARGLSSVAQDLFDELGAAALAGAPKKRRSAGGDL